VSQQHRKKIVVCIVQAAPPGHSFPPAQWMHGIRRFAHMHSPLDPTERMSKAAAFWLLPPCLAFQLQI
jgi:hypothetical protein